MPIQHTDCLVLTWTDLIKAGALALRAKLIVELGTGSGRSADAFLSALKVTDGVLYSVDINPFDDPIKSTVERLKGEKRFVFIHGDSIEVGKKWDKGNIDFLLCDSDHAYTRVLEECEVWGRFNPKVIFIHDTIMPDGNLPREPGGYAAGKKYAEEHGKIFFNFLVHHGLGVIS